MDVAAVILATLAFVALAGLATLVGVIYLDRRTITRKRVAVVLASGDTLIGFLWARRLRHIHLKDVVIRSEGNDANLDGDVIVDRDQVTFVQLLEA
jgi:hypothetical protein